MGAAPPPPATRQHVGRHSPPTSHRVAVQPCPPGPQKALALSHLKKKLHFCYSLVKLTASVNFWAIFVLSQVRHHSSVGCFVRSSFWILIGLAYSGGDIISGSVDGFSQDRFPAHLLMKGPQSWTIGLDEEEQRDVLIAITISYAHSPRDHQRCN